MYKDFKCTMQLQFYNHLLNVIAIKLSEGTVMAICHKEGPIYITKDQAKKFFNLKEKTNDKGNSI